MSLKSTQYISGQQNYFRPGAEKQAPSVSIQIQDERRLSKGPISSVVDIRDEYNYAEEWNYLDIYQLYLKAQVTPRIELSAGRKLETWTEWEQTWGQGLFQPRYLENKLNPRAAGLTGAFLKTSGENLSAALAVTANIPDFGPMHTVNDDRFESANPWFKPPASSFEAFGVTTPIHYSVKRPSTESVVNHAGAAGKIEYRTKKSLNRLSLAYKPIPQLLFMFPSAALQIGADHMHVQINTRVRYHQVAAWDSVVQAGGWRLSASAAHERPEDDGGPLDFTSQQVSPAWIYALSASRALEEEGPSAARLTFGYLRILGGDAPDRGEYASEETLFEQRFQYQDAYMIELSKPVRGWFARPLETGLRLLFDRAQNGGVVSLRTGLEFSRQLRADLSLDLLGLLGREARVKDGFLTTYRANDRVELGMSYVF